MFFLESLFDFCDISGELLNTLVFDLIGNLGWEVIVVEGVVEVFLSIGFEDFLDLLATDLFLEVLSFLTHRVF